jgi:oligopeptidase B
MSHKNPPIAKKVEKELIIHDDVRLDNYYWLNDKEDKEVISYLEAENSYYETLTAHTKEFQEKLFQEMKGRIKEDDSSVPYKLNDYWYSTRYVIGGEYPLYSRFKHSLEATEEIMFNGNDMAKGHDYFSLGGIAISPDNKLAAFGIDTVSRRQYTLQIKNLETGVILDDKIENTTGGGVWANDNKTLFYTRKDPVTLRSDKIYKHKLGTPTSEDVLIFHEDDDTFSTFIYRTKSKKYLVIGSFSTLTSEFQILPTDNPDGEFMVFSPRKRGLEYTIFQPCIFRLVKTTHSYRRTIRNFR